MFDVGSRSRKFGARKYKVSRNEQPRAKDANLIFALDLFVVACALRALGNRDPDTSMSIFVDDDSASQVLTRGGSNYPLINHLIGPFRSLVAHESMRIWLEKVCSASNPADAPSQDRNPPAEITDENPFPR